jgi:hypothetical protein
MMVVNLFGPNLTISILASSFLCRTQVRDGGSQLAEIIFIHDFPQCENLLGQILHGEPSLSPANNMLTLGTMIRQLYYCPNLGNNLLDSSTVLRYISARGEQDHERTEEPARSDSLLL